MIEASVLDRLFNPIFSRRLLMATYHASQDSCQRKRHKRQGDYEQQRVNGDLAELHSSSLKGYGPRASGGDVFLGP